ncbi:MFS transporter [Spirosoma utsteinense]|uniref:MFS family permease n=1 Tax=Spirosoma utsteinense TaxID=2585773 RepID=A0ABR6W317_9BACT|nr:MFS transporter [Spirosoma utsteinense]MBC3786638.1 MFS family permease [Spirosoma utsteinense]MBC3791001.1 MFS family permease [Spirosoma utsteinense]
MQALSPTPTRPSLRLLFALPVIVSALGFFVDVYDMLIFSIVRVPSLQSLGLSEADVSKAGTFILNCQQAGLLVGGILWGVLGDKRGRMSVLFGSIITYSLTNIACGFVQDVNSYALLRFVAGVGLSGEIGAAMVLVSEILPKEIRGYGSSIVAGIGYLGAGVAYFTVEYFNWRMAFWVGGGMGLALLLLRVSVFESGLFSRMKTEHQGVGRGNFFHFFSSWPNALKYLRCVAVGLPTWFIVGILGTFANEFGQALGIAEVIKPGRCVMMIYVGLAGGDLLSGPLSQWLKSRLRTIILLLIFSLLLSTVYLFGGISTASGIYTVCLLAGFCTGYIAMYLTTVAESYGTNLRATATTSAPSVVRGLLIPMTLFFQALKPGLGALVSAGLLGLLVYGLAFWSLSRMEETYGKDMDFVE